MATPASFAEVHERLEQALLCDEHVATLGRDPHGSPVLQLLLSVSRHPRLSLARAALWPCDGDQPEPEPPSGKGPWDAHVAALLAHPVGSHLVQRMFLVGLSMATPWGHPCGHAVWTPAVGAASSACSW